MTFMSKIPESKIRASLGWDVIEHGSFKSEPESKPSFLFE
jgi:hypothetical protein